MSFCGYCGSQMPDDMRFCTKCGKPLSFDTVSHNIASPESEKTVETIPYSDSSSVYEVQENLNVINPISGNKASKIIKKDSKVNFPLIFTILFASIAFILFLKKITPYRIADNSSTTINTPVETESGSSHVQTNADSSSESNNISSSSVSVSQVTTERTERDCTDSAHRDVEMEHFTLSVPLIFSEPDSSSSSKVIAKAEYGHVILFAEVSRDEMDCSVFKELDTYGSILITRISSQNIGGLSVGSVKCYDAGGIPGLLGSLSGYDDKGNRLTGRFFMFPTKDYNRMISIYLIQDENTQYLYNDEFVRIIDSLSY